MLRVLAVAGEKGIGANLEALVRAFSSNLVDNVLLAGAGHFVAEERPLELTAALQGFLAQVCVSLEPGKIRENG